LGEVKSVTSIKSITLRQLFQSLFARYLQERDDKHDETVKVNYSK